MRTPRTRFVSPTKFQRKVLVWVGRYKTVEEIPTSVPIGQLDNALSRGRIRICNYMIVLTLIGCLGMAISGRRAAARGESLVQMNADWHKKYEEEYNETNKSKP